MFSLIKYVQSLLERFKKNKALWFTTITAISILGILVSMYIITTITSDVSKKIYTSMSKEYNLRIDNFLVSKKSEFKKIVITLNQDQKLLDLIETNNDIEIKNYEKKINDTILQNGINNYKIEFYSTLNKDVIFRNSVNSVINSKNPVYGIDVTPEGVFNVFIQPLIKDDDVYGVIEVKESIHNYRKYFEGIDDEYVFLLDKKILPKLSINAKNGKYRDIIDEYTVAQTFYDTKFTASIAELSKEEYSQFIKEKFIIDGIYYRTYKTVSDVNGVDIGIIVMGELIDKENGFVNLTDNMTKTVTMVALGLVISIILFMF